MEADYIFALYISMFLSVTQFTSSGMSRLPEPLSFVYIFYDELKFEHVEYYLVNALQGIHSAPCQLHKPFTT